MSLRRPFGVADGIGVALGTLAPIMVRSFPAWEFAVTELLWQIPLGIFALMDEIQVGPFTTTQSGNLVVTADWGNAENSIGLGLYQGTCTGDDILEDRLTGTCSDAALLAEADTVSGVKPNVLTALNLAPGTYSPFSKTISRRFFAVAVSAEKGHFLFLQITFKKESSAERFSCPVGPRGCLR